MEIKRFNIRVYGLWVNDGNDVLVTDEIIGSRQITKFPGGGLEYGEGLAEGLKREWQEELNVDIKIKEHFYINDFFQVSAFDHQDQVISVYYLVEPVQFPQVKITTRPFEFEKAENGAQVFRFIPLNMIKADDMTLAIDRIVAEMLASMNR